MSFNIIPTSTSKLTLTAAGEQWYLGSNDSITNSFRGINRKNQGDQIDLSDYGIVSWAALNSSGAITSSSGNAVIDLSVLGGSGTIIIEGADGLMTQDDFIL